MLTVLSPDAVQMLLEKGCHLQELTESTWPRKVWRQRRLERSQRRIVWSIEHDARKSPVWWKAQSQTACVWSVKVVACSG